MSCHHWFNEIIIVLSLTLSTIESTKTYLLGTNKSYLIENFYIKKHTYCRNNENDSKFKYIEILIFSITIRQLCLEIWSKICFGSVVIRRVLVIDLSVNSWLFTTWSGYSSKRFVYCTVSVAYVLVIKITLSVYVLCNCLLIPTCFSKQYRRNSSLTNR